MANKVELHRANKTNERGRSLELRVNKVGYTNKKGQESSFQVIEMFEPFKFTRKNDSWDGKKKEGEEDFREVLKYLEK